MKKIGSILRYTTTAFLIAVSGVIIWNTNNLQAQGQTDSAPKPNRTADSGALFEKFVNVRYSWEQEAIALELIALGDPKIIPKMEKYLEITDRSKRCNAALVLAGLGDKRGLDVIVRELEDKEIGNRYVDPNGRYNGPVPRPMPDETNESYQKRCLAAMLPILGAHQLSQDRYHAARLLGILKKKEAVPALIAATSDEAVNYIAALSLGKIKDKRAIPALKKMIDAFPANRLYTAWALAALGETRGFDILDEIALSHAHWTDRRHAVTALGEAGEVRSVPVLVKALKDEHANVRVAAARSLGNIGDPTALPALNQALNDTETTKVNAPTTVEREARLAIEEIRSKRK